MTTETLDFAAAWRSWHDAREVRLRDPQGWLAITAIHWLGDEPQRFDDVPGGWVGSTDVATVTLRDDESLSLAGATLAAGVHEIGPLDVAGVTLSWTRDDGAAAIAQVARRPGGVILRPRHHDSPGLQRYAGTPAFAATSGWVLPGRFEAYVEPDGDAVGEVAFTALDGSPQRLVARGEPDGSLWILFRDATSGISTYSYRQIVVDAPAADGSVRIDFNRAINMPCAYTHFATCPVPPAANTLPIAVEAGEMRPLTSAEKPA